MSATDILHRGKVAIRVVPLPLRDPAVERAVLGQLARRHKVRLFAGLEASRVARIRHVGKTSRPFGYEFQRGLCLLPCGHMVCIRRWPRTRRLVLQGESKVRSDYENTGLLLSAV